MQLRQIKAFVAIAETGSLRAAAVRLGVTQPTLTKSLRELETELGVTLIQRTVRGSSLTSLGDTFLLRARVILEEGRRAKEELLQMSGGAGSVVTIGLSTGASLLYANDAFAEFMRTHPQVQVRIIHGLFDQLVNGVRQGRFDFSVGGMSTAETGAQVVIEPLFRDAIRPAARHDHPGIRARSFSELTPFKWAITNDEPGYLPHLTRHFASLNVPAPEIALRCESFFAILQLIPHTDLIVAMPTSLLGHPLVAAQLTPIDVKESLPTTVYSLVHKAGVPLTPLAEELAEIIRHETKKMGRYADA